MSNARIFILALAGAVILAASPVFAQTAPDGKAIFQKNCAACHQANGKGIPGAFPALAGSAFVQGDSMEVAAVLLKGRGGMPVFGASLDDGEIAAVLGYVRASWGNKAGAPGAPDIAQLRTALNVAPAGGGRFANKH
jgi:cytochrome c6